MKTIKHLTASVLSLFLYSSVALATETLQEKCNTTCHGQGTLEFDSVSVSTTSHHKDDTVKWSEGTASCYCK